jgi:UDP-N-acetylglucosamine kinase
MTPTEERIQAEALAYAKRERRTIARRLTDPNIYLRESEPVSVFMAGSPGAGKTEASIELLKTMDGPIIRIDPDDLRCMCPGYDGSNAWLFQPAVSVLVEKVLDEALDNGQSFLLDGTLSRYGVAEKNVARSLGKGRTVEILYVYQEPRQAWAFVRAREALEGRRIRKEEFISQYFAAREVVNALKAKYGNKIRVELLIKNNDNSRRAYEANIDRIDNHIPEVYSRQDLEASL